MTFKVAGSAVAHTAKWTLKNNPAKGRYASNSNAGGRKSTVGVADYTGSVTIFIHAGEAMQLKSGTEYAVVFHGTATTDTITGTIMVEDVGDIVFDADSGDPVSCDYTFGVQGIPTGAGAFAFV
jgi:uncharacterized protein involved in type VI secretion and phage assembly